MGDLIRRGLHEKGHGADLARTGEDALWMGGATAYDAIVLNVMLPSIDGFEPCRRWRADGVRTQLRMRPAGDAVEDRSRGLPGGAADYVWSRFCSGELLPRLRALARRGPVLHPAV